MKKLVVIIAFLFQIAMVSGQGIVCGKIVDRQNNQSLSDVAVYLDNLRVYSDTAGSFYFPSVEPGRYGLSFLYTGYKDVKRDVNIIKGDSLHFEIFMESVAIDLHQTVVTASRYRQRMLDIPGRMNLAGPEIEKALPVDNVDRILTYLPNIYISRTRGIFTKSTGITMRGLSGTARTLVLLDGMPLNKSTGGSINWDLVNPESVEKVEVYKGPGSAL